MRNTIIVKHDSLAYKRNKNSRVNFFWLQEIKYDFHLGMPSKKKTSYGRKSSFLGGEGVRKKGQISLVKEQKK